MLKADMKAVMHLVERSVVFFCFCLFHLTKKDLVNDTLLLKNSMSLCAARRFRSFIKIKPEKTFLFFPQNGCTRKACIDMINRKEHTLPKKFILCTNHFEEVAF